LSSDARSEGVSTGKRELRKAKLPRVLGITAFSSEF
jgi:hypothetical protein